MGLYDKQLYNELKDVASIRNDFAHKIEYSSFHHEVAKSKIMSLRLILGTSKSKTNTTISSPKLGTLLEFNCGNGSDIFKDPKYVFQLTASIIIAALQSVIVKAPRSSIAAA